MSFKITCLECNHEFAPVDEDSLDGNNVYYWEGESPSEIGITIECPACKYEEDY